MKNEKNNYILHKSSRAVNAQINNQIKEIDAEMKISIKRVEKFING